MQGWSGHTRGSRAVHGGRLQVSISSSKEKYKDFGKDAI